MTFKILFYQEKGSFPVQEYIKNLDEAQQNKIIELALARISHTYKEKCARRAEVQMGCVFAPQGLSFSHCFWECEKLCPLFLLGKAVFSIDHKSMRKPG